MKSVIASRVYYDSENRARTYMLELSAPVLNEHQAYTCDIRIVGAPEELDHMTIAGNDSFQALFLGIEALEMRLKKLNEECLGSRLRYLDDEKTDLRFK